MTLAAGRIDKLLDRQQLRDFMEHVETGCVSIYMPTHRGGPDILREDPIRLKNLLQQAREQLIQIGWRTCDARDYLAELNDLLDDSDFWRHNDHGLAMFISSLKKGVFRVPVPVESRVVVASRFYLKPLMPLLARQTNLYILALSQDEVRLLEANSFGQHRIKLPAGTPQCLEDLTKFEEVTTDLEFHTGTAPQHPAARRPVVRFGQAGGAMDESVEKRRLLWYCRVIHPVVDKLLINVQTGYIGGMAPLLLAGVEPLLSIYREVSTYPAISEQHLAGNVRLMSDEDLRLRAWKLLQDKLEQPIARDASRYRQAAAAGQASGKLDDVVPAACDCRVDTLFVSREGRVSGRYDPVSRKVEVHDQALPGDQDLLDLAAVRTYLGAGRVHIVPAQQMPNGGGPLAAIFRYVA